MTAYYTRRKLTLKEQLPAVGAAAGVGAAVFYLARLWLQRTPLRDEPPLAPVVVVPPPPRRAALPERG